MNDGVNRGKQFEEQIKKAFIDVQGTSILRLPDNMSGYKGSKNPCDFIVYKYPYQYMIECKSCHGIRFPFSNITEFQYDSLKHFSQIKGVVAGYMIWFIDCDITLYVSAHRLVELKEIGGAKSIIYNQYEYEPMANMMRLTAKKKRVLMEYDLIDFLKFPWQQAYKTQWGM